MEENYQGYNQPEYENDDPRKGANKSILGYRIVIIILAVILAAITVLYYNIHRQQQADYDLLVIDRDSIQNNLSDLMQDFDDLQLSNDTLSLQMGIERQRADSLMQRLKQERSWSLAKIKQYEKEVGTLRTIMRGYLHQIDSLNTLNKKLIDENVSYRKEITTAQMRAEMAEEKAQELNNKVRQGSVINARGIRMVALNARSKEVSRIKNAERLRVDFTLTANALATPGEKTIYVRILSPDGYVLSSESVPTFEFEGERLSYSASRDVDYQNEDLNIGIFYTGSGFTAPFNGRKCGIRQSLAHHADLFLNQIAGNSGQIICDPGCGSMRSMRRTKCIVDINFGQACKLFCKCGIIFLFFLVKTRIFQHHDLSFFQSGGFCLRVFANYIFRLNYFHPQKFTKSFGGRNHGIFRIIFALRFAHMGDQNHFRLVIN